jgi:hypothetical protein
MQPHTTPVNDVEERKALVRTLQKFGFIWWRLQSLVDYYLKGIMPALNQAKQLFSWFSLVRYLWKSLAFSKYFCQGSSKPPSLSSVRIDHGGSFHYAPPIFRYSWFNEESFNYFCSTLQGIKLTCSTISCPSHYLRELSRMFLVER